MRERPKHIILFVVLLVISTQSANAQFISQLSSQFQPVVQLDTLMSKKYPKLNFYLPSEDLHLGVACKIENKQYYFDKKKFNYRMRLGNLDYVNYLEGKTQNY